MSYYINRVKGIVFSKMSTLGLRGAGQAIAKVFSKNTPLEGNTTHFELSNLETHKHNLKETGITYLGKIISDEVIAKITASISNLKCHDTWSPELGEFQLSDVTKKTHTASFKRNDLVKDNTIIDIANNSSVLEIVKDYLEQAPTISNVNAWWSFAGRENAQQAQNYHRDNDDIKFCKLFIYLTDVTDASGPHIYVKNTVNSKKLRVIKRYTDEEVEKNFPKEDILTLNYPKGHAFIEDTYGIHKGQLPLTENRLLLQIQYSVSPIGYVKYQPEETNYTGEFSKYINRLILK